MMGLPLSWVFALAAIGAIASYIFYLKWKRGIAERKAAEAFRERDNAVVKHQSTSQAQAAEHAYQQAHDKIVQGKPSRAQSLLERLNNTAPLLLCLAFLGGCAPQIKTVYVNPAKEVVIPAALPLEHYQWQDVLGYHCLDDAAAQAYLRNDIKINARTDGLEAALRKLGATVK